MSSPSTNDADTTQTDADAPDSADKPPHVSSGVSSQNIIIAQPHASRASSRNYVPSPSSERTLCPPNAPYIPAAKQYNAAPFHNMPDPSPSGSITPPSVDSPGATVSGSECYPSSPPTRNTSRAPSMSEEHSKDQRDTRHQPATPKPLQTPALKSTSPPRRAPSQVSVSETGGHKFNLRDLLGSSPALARRPSNRSASSRRSDSERGASSMGETTASLAKKYGVCERLAIGKGATSVVRLVHKWDRTEEKLYAVKEFRKRRKNETEKEYVKKLTAEFCISSTLHHPNIVETVDLVQDEQQRWCEVMEYCPGGDLYAAIKKGGMSTSEVECCFKQIISGIDYLHSQGVAHRDIKPENLFFDIKGGLKIGDYGASTVYRLPWEATVHLSTGLCGSEPYIAPEQFSGKPYDARLVDVWACGIVYYCMTFQELPWRVAQPSDALYSAYTQAASTTKSEAVAGSCPAAINSLQPRACRPVLRKMLEPDPKKRWQIKDILANSWAQGVEVCSLTDKPSHVHAHARAMLQLHADKTVRRE